MYSLKDKDQKVIHNILVLLMNIQVLFIKIESFTLNVNCVLTDPSY